MVVPGGHAVEDVEQAGEGDVAAATTRSFWGDAGLLSTGEGRVDVLQQHQTLFDKVEGGKRGWSQQNSQITQC